MADDEVKKLGPLALRLVEGLLQSIQKKATVQDLIDCNRLLKMVQDSPDAGISYKYHQVGFDNAIPFSGTDASHAADADVSKSSETVGNRSHWGRMIFMANKDFITNNGRGVYLLEYHSTEIRRVCRSTMQAETMAMVQGYEDLEHVRSVLHGLDVNGTPPQWTSPTTTSSQTADPWKATSSTLELALPQTNGSPSISAF